MPLDLKQWLRDNIKVYLKEIKAQIASVSGTLVGSYATVAAAPTTGIDTGDWFILTSDDGTNESGIYSWNGTAWGFAADTTSFTEIVTELFVANTDTTSTDKTYNAATLVATFAKIAGDNTQKFSAAAPDAQTDEVVRANDFDFLITDAEAQADYTAA